jgi:uncharacterized repeat protein (TIGR01451 family)
MEDSQKMSLRRLATAIFTALVLAAATAASAAAVGGPVILGGDDLQDHGQVDSSGNSEQGWLYIQRAVGNIKAQVGRSNDNSIAAFGSSDPGTVDEFSDGNAGAAIKNAAAKNGMGIQFFEGSTEINNGMASIANGSYRPAIIWLAGTGADNNFDSCSGQGTEGQAVTDNVSTMNNFVNQGGGLMSHGVCYDWLAALIPGLQATGQGSSDDLYRTSAGEAQFPDVSNDDFNAGPWHNHFEGDFGGLDVLVRSSDIDDSQTGQDAAVFLGGGQVSLTERPTDLVITKADSVDPSPVNRDLEYTVLVENKGQETATGVTVTDDLPSGLSARSTSASQGSCSGTTTVTCNLGDIAPGGNATVRITVTPTQTGTITNQARVSGNQPDPNDANNSVSESTTITAAQEAQARRDRSRPRVIAAGLPRGCVRRPFSARFRVRDASGVRRVSVFLDGRRIKRTTTNLFAVRINARRLRPGRHRIRVVAIDRAGNRRTLTRVFARCAQVRRAPSFTG